MQIFMCSLTVKTINFLRNDNLKLVQGVLKKGYPLNSSVSAACSNLNALTP